MEDTGYVLSPLAKPLSSSSHMAQGAAFMIADLSMSGYPYPLAKLGYADCASSLVTPCSKAQRTSSERLPYGEMFSTGCMSVVELQPEAHLHLSSEALNNALES